MHMADALISATVGGSLWAVSGATLAGCSRRLRREGEEARVPLMGVLGAFVFAAQMVNFAIPGTGSSGHLGGGLLLAALLGPHAAVLVMGSVMLVQALFFADGGLLAFGCNLFNLGIVPAFIAYPLVYRPLARRGHPAAGALLGSLAALQLGALGVVLETTFSSLAGLPFRGFLLTMLSIHLPIGLVEGLVTAGLLRFVAKARPALLSIRLEAPDRPFLGLLLGLALAVGGILSWAASARPDGLEWSVAQVTGQAPTERAPSFFERLQKRLAPLPDYGFPKDGPVPPGPPRSGTSLSGLLGGLLTLGLVALAGWWAARRRAVKAGD
jgi:cobalt/nickel transport system permease protein